MTDPPERLAASVVVPSFGRPELLRRCLQALARQSEPALEVIVVGREEDAPTADAVAACRTTFTVPLELLHTSVPGHLPPLATGVAAARGDVVAFLDDDAEPWPDWLAALLRHYREPLVGGVGGLVSESGHGSPSVSKTVLKIGRLGRFDRLGSTSVPERWGARRVDALRGTNMSFRAALLREYRWDARLNRGAATDYEIDLCHWIRARGYALVYDPDAIVTHHTARRPEIGRNWTPETIESYSHNLVYVSGKTLGVPRATLAVGQAFLIGNRASYGALTAAVDALRPSTRATVATRFIPAIRGKVAGLCSLWAYARRGPLSLDDDS